MRQQLGIKPATAKDVISLSLSLSLKCLTFTMAENDLQHRDLLKAPWRRTLHFYVRQVQVLNHSLTSNFEFLAYVSPTIGLSFHPLQQDL